MLLLRMLSLGQGAWDMIDSQVFKEPRLVRMQVTADVGKGLCCFVFAFILLCFIFLCEDLFIFFSLIIFFLHFLSTLCLQDLEVVTRFLPAMMSVVVDDHMFTVEQKLPSEEKSSLTYPVALPDAFNR